MPLDSEGWADASPEHNEYRSLLSFLGRKPDQAYAATELVETLTGPYPSTLDTERCRIYAETLVELELLEKRVGPDDDRSYYRITDAGLAVTIPEFDQAAAGRPGTPGTGEDASGERIRPGPVDDG